MHLTQLELQPRVKRALLRAGYTDTQRIHAASDEELLGIKDIGPGALKELRTHPIILAEAGADQLLLAEMERVKLEADEKVRTALSSADETVRAAEEGLRRQTEEARGKLAEAERLSKEARAEMGRLSSRAKALSSLEPLLEGAELIREYHQLRTKKWLWPSVRPHSITFSVGGSGDIWYVKAVPEGVDSNKAAILKVLLDNPEYLLKLHEIATEAAGVVKRLEEVAKQLSVLMEPIQLFKIWREEQERREEEARVREATTEEVSHA